LAISWPLDGPSHLREDIFELPKIKQDGPKIAFEKIFVKKKTHSKTIFGLSFFDLRYLVLIFAISF